MGILKVLEKGIKAAIDEITTPESFKIGEAFEKYLRNELFPANYYDMLEKTHNYTSNREDYVKSSLQPDYKFLDKRLKKEFFVEAKFRSGMVKGKIVWCNESQLRRYQEYNKTTPVFILIGIGDQPNHPESVALIPITKALYTGFFPNYLQQFIISTHQPVSSNLLWNRV